MEEVLLMATYNPVTPEIIAQLEQVVPGRVVVGADVNPDYARDEMPIYGVKMPEVSIDVLTTEEVAGIVKICYDNNIPVTTRGAGTGLVGGCTPRVRRRGALHHADEQDPEL